jgi:hemerythrin-like domain-containing protein
MSRLTKAGVAIGVSLPGVRSPGVGFEAPFEMLEACHERVQRMLDLLTRLRNHVAKNGCDVQANDAAVDVMRYFDLAAPLHHQDEELHVFPAVLAMRNDQLDLLVLRLRQEHLEMENLWCQVRLALARVEQENANTKVPFSQAELACMDAFVAIYINHIRSEEGLVFPGARRELNPEQMSVISREMTRRRGGK